jgi:hypothetical protein
MAVKNNTFSVAIKEVILANLLVTQKIIKTDTVGKWVVRTTTIADLVQSL